ncbi:hypothetical protein [Streptomyces sp. NPDC046805]|uniref:hypothetical protein n=1 Tax=Streptomyces sp. NPDC046805 TaxID=3155134 RepID=UPI00340A7450
MTTSARPRGAARMWLAGLASVVALTVAGCGDGNGDEVASAGKATAGSGAHGGASELTDYIEAQRKWVGCLRGEGLDAPDPDAQGRVDLGDQSKWKRDPKALKAQEKCAKLSVPVPQSVEKAQRPELSAAEKKKNEQYARCMQEHGAPDFPDTGPDGHFMDVTWDSTSAGAKRATRQCASIIGVPTDAPPAKG